MEKQLEQLEVKYPTKARGLPKFNKALSHKIVAGADVMVITSRFEPCTLIQLQAMIYGTVAINSYSSISLAYTSLHICIIPFKLVQICLVASVGGLVDTVKDGYTGFQMGAFNFDVNYPQKQVLFFLFSLCNSVTQNPLFCLLVWCCGSFGCGCSSQWCWKGSSVYGNPTFTEMVHNCMAQDLSWKVSNTTNL